MFEKRNMKIIRHSSTYGLYLFVLLLPFEYLLAQFGIGSILKYIGILTMGLAVLDIIMLYDMKIRLNYRTTIIIIWIIYVLFSILWAIDDAGAKYYASIYINNALMFLFISVLEYRESEKELLKNAFLIGGVAFLFYMTFVPGAVVYSSWQHRLTIAALDGSELLDQNYLSALLLIPFALAFSELIEKKRKVITKMCLIMYCVAIIYYIIATGSRSGLLALCVIIACVLNKNAKKHAFILMIIVGVGFLLLPILIENMSLDILERYTLEAMTGQTSESDDRLLIWKSAIQSLNNIGRVIIGYGVGSAEKIVGLNYLKNAAVHNVILAHLIEFGFVGSIMFFNMLFKVIKELKNYQYFEYLFGFYGILFMGFFLDLLTTKFFWTSLIVASICISGKNDRCLNNCSEVKK